MEKEYIHWFFCYFQIATTIYTVLSEILNLSNIDFLKISC